MRAVRAWLWCGCGSVSSAFRIHVVSWGHVTACAMRSVMTTDWRTSTATGRCDPSLISHRYDTAIGPRDPQPPSRAAPVPSRGDGRVWPPTLIHGPVHGNGQSPPPQKRQPQPGIQQATDRRRLAPAYSARSRAVPYTADLTVPRDTTGGARRRSPGRLPETLSGERRQGLGPEPATSPGQCELSRGSVS